MKDLFTPVETLQVRELLLVALSRQAEPVGLIVPGPGVESGGQAGGGLLAMVSAGMWAC